jgi:hypothetical protein
MGFRLQQKVLPASGTSDSCPNHSSISDYQKQQKSQYMFAPYRYVLGEVQIISRELLGYDLREHSRRTCETLSLGPRSNPNQHQLTHFCR